MDSLGHAGPDPEPTGAPGGTEVCLVSMPYATVTLPSLALGLLKSLLVREGIATSVVHANLWFLETVGLERFHICEHLAPIELQVGEWTFAEAAFRERTPDDAALFARLRRRPSLILTRERPAELPRLFDDLRALRRAATAFVDAAARRVLATGARIVGCTSTFEQHLASLALLRRVRELDPGVVTVLGGGNCEAAMGRATHRHFPWIDYVVSGEADGFIAPLCRALLSDGRDVPAERLPAGVLGPCHRALPASDPPRATFHALDTLPYPDFDDYFAALAASPMREAIVPGLPVETARGCWWGARHHCTFCGLNGGSMGFRSKSPDRAVAEFEHLERRYRLRRFEAVDNILDMGYLKTVVPRLGANGGAGRSVFYEVKANLTRAQVEVLAAAGVHWLQPGIESLHSSLLRLMDKGVQGFQNIQLLKWAREFGVRLSWQMLWGFPGEDDAWYAEMAAVLPLLEHLQPPGGITRLRLDRFSIYHERPEDFGLELRPVSSLRWVYPLSEDACRDLTYFFQDVDAPETIDWIAARPGVGAAVAAVKRWRRGFWTERRPILAMQDDGRRLVVHDSRRIAGQFTTRLAGLARAVLLACDGAPPRGRLPEVLAREHGVAVPARRLDAAVDSLLARRFLLAIDGRLVTLPVRGELPQLPTFREFPGGWVDYRRGLELGP
jgi:ribosomal peptide maturation radical SAM protein 1